MLDNDELRATRKLHGLDDGMYGDKMSEADKMFEKLEYKLEFEDEKSFTLANREEGRYITFMKNNKTLMLPCELTMQELQAINKKCKELGWIDK